MFESLQERLGSALKTLSGRGNLSERNVSEALEEISRTLTEADVALEVVRSFKTKVHSRAIGQEVLRSITPSQMVIKIVHEELIELLGKENVPLNLSARAPIIIMMVGLQGAGKTTTSAKIAQRLTQRENKKVLMASLDTRRPAAREQLQQLGTQINVSTLPLSDEQNPRHIALQAVQAAKTGGFDILILDTAGRTHVDELCMSEMEDIRKSVSPHEVLLVADALIGQSAASLAREFDKRANITGIVLTRMDSDARGGAALSMKVVTGKPVKLIGSGERISDLEEFHPKRMADRILGMGDIISLVEKASEHLDAEKAKALSKKMASGRFDLNDFADQISQMKKMGGISGILSFMPGASKIKNQISAAGFDDKTLTRQLAVISSMTKEERKNPEILKHSRKKRIAAGSGTNAAEINKVLKGHRTLADAMKAMKNPNSSSIADMFPGGMSLSNLLNGPLAGARMPFPEARQKHMKQLSSIGFSKSPLPPLLQMKSSKKEKP